MRSIRSITPEPRGPWMYTDAAGREYLMQLVPMERDPTLRESLQPRAVVFQTEDGWIRVSPVGHDFTPEELSDAELLLLLRHVAGKTGEG